VYSKGFDQEQGFVKRVRRPPTDPVNAVISLLSTFLVSQVHSAVRKAGLDPFLGALHVPEYGRYSLVLDLMEEFRPVIVDTLVFSLFNMGVLKRDRDFMFREVEENEAAGQGGGRETDIPHDSQVEENPAAGKSVLQLLEQRQRLSSAGRPVNLQPEAMRKVIAQFERKLEQTVTYDQTGKTLSYAEIMAAQARQYRMLVEGSISHYQPLLLR
jgi:CRISPR-associated protein Cas1